MKTSLETLIGTQNISHFFEAYQSNSPFLVQTNYDSLRPILELPFLSSLDALLNSWPAAIQAHLPDVRDEISSIDTTPKDAQKLFDNGMGLLFNEAQNISPFLQEFLQGLRKDLGLSSLTYGRCLIYATPDGKGTATHFDQNINFVLQVHGTKKWKVAPNLDVANPLTRHTMGLPADPEMMSYLSSPMPDQMPQEAETFELSAGSLLFVPRGAWHSTEAEGDALALNFTFTAPTWLDLFSAALRSRLALSPEWRETADGVSDPKRTELATQKFDHLLAGLIQDLPHWKAADILGATEFES